MRWELRHSDKRLPAESFSQTLLLQDTTSESPYIREPSNMSFPVLAGTQMEFMHNSPTGVIDVVCGMTVNPEKALHKVGHDGKDFYFCCRSCTEKFSAAPAQYLNKPAKPSSGLVTLGMPMATTAKSATPACERVDTVANTYVCPMCP